ncbi:cytokine receptor family member B12 isoform X2 [Ictalurus punctatus]|nr:cytokine receptor family member B12 isoform X2 [Ictalurus punctatus]XP_017315327.1 cytokine receptor family member B12 isoform X2 [Ictalurus punctatus]
MMACAAAALLALLLSYLASSEGALSPPLNLSVELLDFKALARWLPGPGNPKGTRYSLKFIDISHFSTSAWNQTRDCTNITLTQCYLILNQTIQTEYFVKVKAEWKEERSNWTFLPRSFQPYEYTFLSAPNMIVSTVQNSIWINLSHPVQSLMEVRMKFSVDLFQMTSKNTTEHIAQNITARSSRFVNLPSGKYCINASAFLTARCKRNNNATSCVILHQDHRERKDWVVMVGVFLLLSIPAVIGLIGMYCYVMAFRNGDIHIPLHFTEGTVQILNTEELHIFPISLMFTDVCQVAAHQEMDGNSSQGYYGNSPQHYSGIPSQGYSGISAQGNDGVIRRKDQNVPPVPDFYSTAEKMEETDEYPTQTEHHAYGLPPRTSFSGASLPTDQNVEIENILNLELDKSEEENILTSLYSFEQTDSYEGETDSIASDYLFNSNYEPRPDPALMLSNQFRSQH